MQHIFYLCATLFSTIPDEQHPLKILQNYINYLQQHKNS